MNSKHATVPFHGYLLPLIGVPPQAAQETCDRCHATVAIGEVHFDGQQILCGSCAAAPARADNAEA